MLLPARNDRWTGPWFGPALLLAVLLHAAFFASVVLTMRGAPGQYRVDVLFWGSILRKQDLVPQMLASVETAARVPVLEPSRLLGSAQARGWSLGVMVDKPGAVELRGSAGQGILPVKFPTARVEVDEPAREAVPGIPETPGAPIRMKQQ